MMTRRELPILVFTAIYVPCFTIVALRRMNYEFLLYVAVILLIAGVILIKQRTLELPPGILWGLSIWGLLHMAGGLVPVGNTVLYGIILIPIVPFPYGVLKFDQLVHAYGFAMATLLCHHLLRPYLSQQSPRPLTFWLLVALMGCGLGALNEMVEFLAVITMPQTGVGGYENTLLDLIFNSLGAVLAATWLRWRERSPRRAARSPLPGPAVR